MPKILLAAIISLLIIATGCQKTQSFYEFDLTIFDQNGNTVNGAQVKGYIKPVGNNGVGAYELRESTVSDASGKVNLQIEKESAFSFRFDVSRDGHFSASHEINSDDVPVTKAYEGDLVLNSQAWFRLNIQNISNSIAVFWNIASDAPSCENCCEEVPGENVLQGADVDTSFVCTFYGDQNFQLVGSYTDAEITVNPFNLNLFAPAGDTLAFDLVY